MAPQKFTGNRGLWWKVLLSLGIVLGIAVFFLSRPWNVPNVPSRPHPASSYTDAVDRITALLAREPAAMNPVCRLQFLTHDQKVDRAIILVHGYTTCPQQFKALGQRFFDAGYNVLIAPLPHHGLADRMTEEHASLTAEELAAYADEAADIAQGLGEHVTMMGISGGGVTTAWAAQFRGDIDSAVIISPAFGFKQVPTPLTAAAMNLYTLRPNSFIWWDPVLKEASPPPYAYPRYSTRALVQTLRLGFAIQADARRERPAVQKITVVLNANDAAVNNELTRQVVKIWQSRGANVSTYEFDASLNLDHDLIDPTQPRQRIDIVYPRLIELSGR